MFDGRWRHAVDRTTKPVGTALVRAGITADVLTIFGLVMSVVTAVAVGSGPSGGRHRPPLPHRASPISSTARWPRPRARRRCAAPSSTRWPTASPTPSSSAAWPGTWSAHHHGEVVLLPFAILAVTSLISYQRAKAELLGLSAKGGLMERAERFILLGLCFIAGAVSPAGLRPRAVGVLRAPVRHRRGSVRQRVEGGRRAAAARWPRAVLAEADLDVTRRALARWREGRVDSRWRTWREARAHRDALGARAAVPRRAAAAVGSLAGATRQACPRAVRVASGVRAARRGPRPAAADARRHAASEPAPPPT